MGSCFSVGTNNGNSTLIGNATIAATSTSVPPSQAEILRRPNLKSFSYNVLVKATRDFHPDFELGVGRCGSVVKGWIDDQSLAPAKPGTGTAIAVKMLSGKPSQRDPEWLSKVNYYGRLNHQNLAKLIGYCRKGERRLLVYEFMPQGSLANHLFYRGYHFQSLSWNHRIKIALGAAKGLAYLHSLEPKILNPYFSSSNILIDNSYNAKLCDFEMQAKKHEESEHVVTRPNCYAAPEYISTGWSTTRSDIYSFGVVLLELLTGRRSFDKYRPSNEQALVEFTYPFLSNIELFLHIMDPSIKGQYSCVAATRAALLAKKCVEPGSVSRPNANELVNELEQIQELGSELNDLQIMN